MMQFGSYCEVPPGRDAEVKERLVKQIHEVVDQLAQREDFWIVCEPDMGNPLQQFRTIGWKIAIPQMEEAKLC